MNHPRIEFFAGKGGVGKTTCAAARSIGLAEAGANVLVLSIDPAHSLGDALRARLSHQPRPIGVARGRLRAAEINGATVVERWLGQNHEALHLLADRGTVLDRGDVDSLLGVTIPGVDEILSFIEIWRLGAKYDWIVVDNAPTGHSLRLLKAPAALALLADALDRLQANHRLLTERFGSQYQADAADSFVEAMRTSALRAVSDLRSDRCRFRWVTLPERLSIEETFDGIGALDREDVIVADIIVNRVTRIQGRSGSSADLRVQSEHAALERLRRRVHLPLLLLPSLRSEPTGVSALRPLGRRLSRSGRSASTVPSRTAPPIAKRVLPLKTSSHVDVASLLGLTEDTRLLLFAGKGGVGKTTCAAAAALGLTERAGRRALLVSVDPAHSVGDVLRMRLGDRQQSAGGSGRLRVREMDAGAAFSRHRSRLTAAAHELVGALSNVSGSDFDGALQEFIDLMPPGLDEVAAMGTLLDAVGTTSSSKDLIVIDTAPTGHALRLLTLPETARAWANNWLSLLLKYRQAGGAGRLARELLALSRQLHALSSLLTDPRRTSIVVVTRTGKLPLNETDRLLVALKRLNMPVRAVILNGTAGDRQSARAESAAVRRFAASCDPASRCSIMLAPLVSPPPTGRNQLLRWLSQWDRRT